MRTRSTKHALLEEARAALATASDARQAGEHRLGAESASRALEFAQRAGNLRLQASAHGLLALHQWRVGDAEAAIANCHHALPLLKRERDAGERSQLLCTLVMAYNDVGLHGDALTHVKKALDAARASGDPSLMSWALNRAGATYEQLAAPADAERFMLQALEIARDIKGSEEIFSALNNLCSNLIAGADRLDAATAKAALERAIGHGTEALALAQPSGNAHRQAICHGNLGVAFMRLGDHARALEHVQKGQQLAEANGYRSMALSAVADRAELLGRMGQLDAAIALYEESLAAAHSTDDHALLLSLHHGLYKGYKAQGDAARALAHHEAMLPLERDRMRQRADMQARLLLHRLELEQVHAEAERARLDAEVQRLRAIQLEAENRQLAVKATELGRHALEDQLTGLANRRRVDHELPLQMALARERDGVLSVAVVDLDHFKHVNDRYGHTVGDDVLRTVARILLDKTRGSDLLARMGGEEFLVVFSGTPLNVAVEICERLRQSIESHDWSRVADGLALTISIGVCDAPRDLDVRGLLDRADAALYGAKRAGRNRVHVAKAGVATTGVRRRHATSSGSPDSGK